jgi:hypothetical protein
MSIQCISTSTLPAAESGLTTRDGCERLRPHMGRAARPPDRRRPSPSILREPGRAPISGLTRIKGREELTRYA